MSGGWFLLAGLAVAGPDWSEQPAVQLTAMASILEQKSDVSDGFGAGGAFAATLSTPWFITARISGTQTRHFAGSTRPFSWMARGSIGPQLAWRTHNQKRTGTARRDVVVADRGSLNPHLRHTQLVSKASGLTRQHMNSLSVAAGAYNGLGLDAWGDGIRPEIRISYLNWTAPRFIGSGPEAGAKPAAGPLEL